MIRGLGLLAGGLALDVIAHLAGDPALEQAGHVAILVAMVGMLGGVVAGATRGARHAVR